MKIGKFAKGVGLGTVGVVNVVCGVVINSCAAPFTYFLGDKSPKHEAIENSKFYFEEASKSFKDAFDE